MKRWIIGTLHALGALVVGVGVGIADDRATGDGRVLGHVAFREHRVTIEAGTAGTRYTVRSARGALVATRLDDAGLQARFPELHDQVRRAVAGADAASVQDARVVVAPE